MSKQYKVVINFLDDTTWTEDHLGLTLTVEQIAYTLNDLQKSDSMELTSILTNETKKANQIKSIELLF